SIGDILLTTPLLRALRRRRREARSVYVTKQAMTPLVSDNPHVHDVVALEPDEPIRHLARRLRGLRPTHGLDLHGSVRSAALRLLVRCHWTGYRKRKLARALLIATKLDVYGARVPVAERYFEAARALDTRPDGGPPEFCLSQGARDRVAEWLAQRALAHAPMIAMAPGVGTPVVALFGPTVGQFGFFPYRAPAVVLERPLDCRPCSATGTAHCPMGHHRCLGDIAPADVVAALQRLVPFQPDGTGNE